MGKDEKKDEKKDERDEELEKFEKDPRANLFERFVRKTYKKIRDEEVAAAQAEAEKASKEQSPFNIFG